MEWKKVPLVSDEKAFNYYFKYKHASYVKTITCNDQIYKFKEKQAAYEKVFADIQRNKFIQKKPNEILIFVKENNQKKTYSEQEINSDKEPPKENEEKEGKNVNSEPNATPIEKKEEEKKEENQEKKKKFVVLGGYGDIKKALIKRGWVQGGDEDTDFDLIYTLKVADIHFQDLLPHQIAGHFSKANEITRKSNFAKNVRHLYYKDVCTDNFFPRAYVLSEKSDLEDFIEDFKTTRAVSLLKDCVVHGGKDVNRQMVETSLKIVERKLKFFLEKYNIKDALDKVLKKNFKDKENLNEDYSFKLIDDEEWSIISEEDMEYYHIYIEKLMRNKLIMAPEGKDIWKNKRVSEQILKKKKILNKIQKEKDEMKAKLREEKEKAEKEEKENAEKDCEICTDTHKNDCIISTDTKKPETKKEVKPKEKPKHQEDDEDDDGTGPTEFTGENETNIIEHQRPPPKERKDDCTDLLEKIKDILNQMKDTMPQFILDGTRNIWIAKPGGLSRGRGIHCVDQLNDILCNIRICGQTVIQKYIENPLIIRGRKFDIRQWVLVTDLAPLTIWLFDTPYLRFGAEEYHIDEFKNIYSHLTNNSIAKHSTHFNDTLIEGDMWKIEQFRQFLKDEYGKDYWPEIQEKIRKIVIYSLESAKHKIMHRKNSHEVFGYDLMIDDLLNVYLIEINASPDWSYSTKVTEELVKICSDDIEKVVLDYGENMKLPPNERKEIDTGRMKMIYSGNDFPKYDNMMVNIEPHPHL